jgi:hypothetical protein
VSEPTSPTDRRLVAALRAESPAPSEVRARVRGRLEAAIPGMTRGPDGGREQDPENEHEQEPGGPGPTGGAGQTLGGWGAQGIGIAAFLIGGATGAALVASLSRAPPRIIYVDRPVPQLSAPATPAATSTDASSRPAPTAPHSPTSSPMPSPTSPSPSAPAARSPSFASASPHASRFAEERRLLDDARASLLQGEPENALARLDLHRARFADGLLSEERDAMQVEALVRAGRADDARERARLFRARSPGSLFLPTVESAIASIP